MSSTLIIFFGCWILVVERSITPTTIPYEWPAFVDTSAKVGVNDLSMASSMVSCQMSRFITVNNLYESPLTELAHPLLCFVESHVVLICCMKVPCLDYFSVVSCPSLAYSLYIGTGGCGLASGPVNTHSL
jgi:hypothetical protein